VAIPHGRINGIKDAVGALIRLREPIPFDALDGLPVGLIFVLLVPERATELHLQILGELAQMFSDPIFREQLFSAATEADAHRLLTEWQTHAQNQRRAAV
jgi:PTS system nitrogen regulatory IIA component